MSYALYLLKTKKNISEIDQNSRGFKNLGQNCIFLNSFTGFTTFWLLRLDLDSTGKICINKKRKGSNFLSPVCDFL